MVILRTDAQVPRVAPSLLSLPGSADLGSAGAISATQTASDDTAGDSRSVVVDAGCIRGELTVDAMREGDRMRPLGMKGSRKLSDMLTDAKIPRRLRAAVPIVRDGDEIVWVAGVQMSERYKVTEDTELAFRLAWTGMRIDGVR